ncbi:MAG: SAM-dependent methyltransferase [Lachnospiraceae bacterium]|nr:SAM-dependent methyltransferase [Lachnospiraceae bacterium]
MDKLRQLLTNYIENKEMILCATASNPRGQNQIQKLRIRPVLKKEELLYQVERFAGTKVYHQNLTPGVLLDLIVDAMEAEFRQLELETECHRVTVLMSKKGKMTIKEKSKVPQKQEIDFSHNRHKQYILPQDEPVPFLVELGVQTPEGTIIKAKYDKFRQINRYLEFVRDILPHLPKEEGQPLRIIDFGCGKSYLTFALYYYLKIMNQYDICVVGLDLKKDVIENCQALADKFGYDGLKFQVGDIGSYESNAEDVDMVVTLHACDTATDHALAKAVKWNARVILSVPCCQHEFNRQIACDALAPILKYGLIKERMAALMTDAVRAELLEVYGYDTQILEFIDMEHTPKNILIRAVKRNHMKYHAGTKKQEQLIQLEELLHINPTFQKLLNGIVTREAE